MASVEDRGRFPFAHVLASTRPWRVRRRTEQNNERNTRAKSLLVHIFIVCCTMMLVALETASLCRTQLSWARPRQRKSRNLGYSNSHYFFLVPEDYFNGNHIPFYSSRHLSCMILYHEHDTGRALLSPTQYRSPQVQYVWYRVSFSYS